MSHIFISYARKNIHFAQKIVDALTANNLETWIDWNSIPKGEDWEQEIYRGIEEADAFLFLISPASVKSGMCNKEIGHALKNNKRILPIVICETDVHTFLHESTKDEISKRNWVFCREEQDDFDKAIEEIQITIHTDYAWVQAQGRLQVKALEWERNDKEGGFLLRGKDLQDAELELATNTSKEPYPTDLQREYVFQSRTAIDRQRTTITSISIAGIIVMTALAIFGFLQAKLATERAEIALVRQLAAQAEASSIDFPQRSILLSLESLNIARKSNLSTSTAEQALRKTLAHINGIPLVGHTGQVTAIAISPDSNLIASGAEDATIRLWNISNTEEQPKVLNGHKYDIYRLAFSPSGRWLVSAGRDNAIRLWDMKDSNFGSTLIEEQNTGGFRQLNLDITDNWIASVGHDGSLKVWKISAPTKQPIILHHYDDFVRTVKFSPDGRWLASSGSAKDKLLWIWDMNDTAGEPKLLWGHDSRIESIAFSGDGTKFASGDADGTVLLWNFKDLSQPPINLKVHEGLVTHLAFSFDGRWLASRGDDGKLILWNMHNLTATAVILSGSSADIAFSPDNRFLVSAGPDKSIQLIDLETPYEQPIYLYGHEGWIGSVVFTPDGRWIVSGGYDLSVWLWNMRTLSVEPLVLKPPVEEEKNLNSLVFSAARFDRSGKRLFSSNSYQLDIWDVDNGFVHLNSLNCQGNGGYSILVSNSERWLAAASQNNLLCIWDLADLSAKPRIIPGRPLAFSPDDGWFFSIDAHDINKITTLDLKEDQIYKLDLGMSFEPNTIPGIALGTTYSWLAVSDQYGRVKLFEINLEQGSSPEINESFTLAFGKNAGRIRLLVFSKDQRWLATGIGDNDLYLTDLRNGDHRSLRLPGHQSIHPNPSFIMDLEFSPDSSWLASANNDLTIQLWNLRNPTKETTVLLGNDESVDRIVFADSGSTLISGGRDGTIRLWDLDQLSNRPVVLSSHHIEVSSLDVSPDNRWLASGGSYDGYIRLWRLKLDEIIDTACRAVGRNLDLREWATYMSNGPHKKTCEHWPLPETYP